ncbi:hypothetical protein [Nocardiopsis potens]|uniref:hypothetical protein n=1 Tax=Nocardiopsis potens TaxID=1246458 RepID=UPI000345C1C9|nr:hypothetical protein [Nocardiopsis potens]
MTDPAGSGPGSSPGPATARIRASVHYHLIDLVFGGPGDLLDPPDPPLPREDAGVAEAVGTAVRLTAGPHTGDIDMLVVSADRDPGPDPEYGDVVSVSVWAPGGPPSLIEWAGEAVHPLPPLPAGPGWYRVRYHIEDYDAAHEADVDAEEPVGRHLLQIWPQERTAPEAERITSAGAAYWLERRPPPAPPVR